MSDRAQCEAHPAASIALTRGKCGGSRPGKYGASVPCQESAEWALIGFPGREFCTVHAALRLRAFEDYIQWRMKGAERERAR